MRYINRLKQIITTVNNYYALRHNNTYEANGIIDKRGINGRPINGNYS